MMLTLLHMTLQLRGVTWTIWWMSLLVSCARKRPSKGMTTSWLRPNPLGCGPAGADGVYGQKSDTNTLNSKGSATANITQLHNPHTAVNCWSLWMLHQPFCLEVSAVLCAQQLSMQCLWSVIPARQAPCAIMFTPPGPLPSCCPSGNCIFPLLVCFAFALQFAGRSPLSPCCDLGVPWDLGVPPSPWSASCVFQNASRSRDRRWVRGLSLLGKGVLPRRSIVPAPPRDASQLPLSRVLCICRPAACAEANFCYHPAITRLGYHRGQPCTF